MIEALTEGLERLKLRRGGLRFSAYAAGRRGDPLVVLAHGFPDGPWTWRHQLPALAAAGYYAVAPTIRGYEPSSQPADGVYEIGEVAGDVIAWADDLSAERFHLVGHDWGGIFSYPAAHLHPDRLLSLTTLAVPNIAGFLNTAAKLPSQFLKSWYVNFFQLPLAPEAALERNDWALIRRLWRDWSPSYALSEQEWAALRQLFSAPGVKRAMLGYYRQNLSPAIMVGLRKTIGSQAARIPVRTLAITGAEDGCVDTRLFDVAFRAENYPAGHRIERLEGAGHFAHLEQPETVNRLLLDWFAQT